MSGETQQPPQPPSLPPAQSFFTGTEMLRLLEVSKGAGLERMNDHFYLMSAHLPLSQLDRNMQLIMIYTALSETAYYERLGIDMGKMPIKFDEYVAMAVGQSSRGVGGKEREALITAKQVYTTPEQRQRQGGLSGFIQRLRGD